MLPFFVSEFTAKIRTSCRIFCTSPRFAKQTFATQGENKSDLTAKIRTSCRIFCTRSRFAKQTFATHGENTSCLLDIKKGKPLQDFPFSYLTLQQKSARPVGFLHTLAVCKANLRCARRKHVLCFGHKKRETSSRFPFFVSFYR